jgi:LPS-assembly protein
MHHLMAQMFAGRTRRRLYLLTLLIVLCTLTSVEAQLRDRLVDEFPQEPWHISADEVSYDQQKKLYTAKGKAEISKLNRKLSADLIRFNHDTMRAVADGHVVMTVGTDLLLGERLEIDLNSETGTLHKGRIFLSENHFYIAGDTIAKVSADAYAVQQGQLTTCDGEKPAWRVTARNLEVKDDGSGKARHAALWVRNLPFLYTPYFRFPARAHRKTGFLAPLAGYSDRKGWEYEQPFFWAISDSQDATFYGHYMSKRGLKVGAEYRYTLSPRSQGVLMADYLHDRKTEDELPSDSSIFGFEGDSFRRQNADRYWVRGKIDQQMPYNITAHIDLDIVSDPDYLSEFKDGLSGFTETRNFFRRFMGRDIDPYDDIERVNRLNLNRLWSASSFNGGIHWFDNSLIRQQDLANPTVQRLPYLRWDTIQQPLFSSPLWTTLDSEYTYFYREDGDSGHRIDIYPRLWLPFKMQPYLFLEPSLGFRGSVWYNQDSDPDGPGANQGDEIASRGIFDFRIDLSTQLDRVYHARVASIDRVRHWFRPQLLFEYIPDQDQEDLPLFDDLDRISPRNRITYGLTNTLTYRRRIARPQSVKVKGLNGKPLPDYVYHEFLRFDLGQSYDIVEYTTADDNSTDRPFSPIFARLEIKPEQYIRLKATSEWSVYDRNFVSNNLSMGLNDWRGDTLGVEYRYTRDNLETIVLSAAVNLTAGIRLRGMHERNIRNGNEIQTSFGLLYNAQCWSFDGGYKQEGDEKKFLFMISLHGLGSINSSF